MQVRGNEGRGTEGSEETFMEDKLRKEGTWATQTIKNEG